MKNVAALCLLLLLTACATVPVAPTPATHLFADTLFSPPSVAIQADDVFRLSEAMKHYLQADIAKQLKSKDPQGALFEALYHEGQLKLEYDAEITRNAAETFQARSGNCLSLAIMTAAFAKELGLKVQFQKIFTEESWSRNNGIFFASGHVNIVLGASTSQMRDRHEILNSMTIDFFPTNAIYRQRASPITELTITAMYMNNRAAESLARGQVDDAYWWTREAIKQDATFVSAYNTLGVIYRRRGNATGAEQVFNHVLAIEPQNVQTLSNLALLLRDQGRLTEAGVLTARLERLQPNPPYYYFDLGQVAMHDGDYAQAKSLFLKEVNRDEFNHEFQFWLSLAYFKLGDTEQAKKHMGKAMKNSNTRKEHDLYAAKLERLSSLREQSRLQ